MSEETTQKDSLLRPKAGALSRTSHLDSAPPSSESTTDLSVLSYSPNQRYNKQYQIYKHFYFTLKEREEAKTNLGLN